VTADSNGITSTTDRRRLGPTVTADRVDTQDALNLPRYATDSDVPGDLTEGTLVYVEDTETVFVETGN
jgi:hypothetical protein